MEIIDAQYSLKDQNENEVEVWEDIGERSITATFSVVQGGDYRYFFDFLLFSPSLSLINIFIRFIISLFGIEVFTHDFQTTEAVSSLSQLSPPLSISPSLPQFIIQKKGVLLLDDEEFDPTVPYSCPITGGGFDSHLRVYFGDDDAFR